MNILHLINYAGSGGTEKYVLTLLRRQIAAGHACVLVYNTEGPLVRDAQEAGAAVIQLPLRHILDNRAAKRLAGICREYGIRVIHAHYPRENCIAILAARRLPEVRVVTTSHLVFACDAKWRIINRIFSPHNHAVLCVCEAQLAQLRANGVRPDRLRVVHNGVAPERVENPAALREEIRREFSIPQDAVVAASLTRYEPVKGMDMLLDVARILQKQLPEMRFLIAGTGSEYDAVRETLRREHLEDFFIQAGFRRDTDAILCASDIYLNTSRSEALSFAITEAMSLEKPAVITAVGGNPEIVTPESGCLVPFGDARAMADAIAAIAADGNRRAHMGKCAAARVREEFSEEVMFEKTMEAYTEA